MGFHISCCYGIMGFTIVDKSLNASFRIWTFACRRVSAIQSSATSLSQIACWCCSLSKSHMMANDTSSVLIEDKRCVTLSASSLIFSELYSFIMLNLGT